MDKGVHPECHTVCVRPPYPKKKYTAIYSLQIVISSIGVISGFGIGKGSSNSCSTCSPSSIRTTVAPITCASGKASPVSACSSVSKLRFVAVKPEEVEPLWPPSDVGESLEVDRPGQWTTSCRQKAQVRSVLIQCPMQSLW